jgi:hypothetical protein
LLQSHGAKALLRIKQRIKTLKLMKSSCLRACVLQAAVKPPTVQNIYKSLVMQYTLGAIPVFTFIGYWAYGNAVSQYMLFSSFGPTWLITVANCAAFLQILVTIHVSTYMHLKLLNSSSSSSASQAPLAPLAPQASTHLIGIFLHSQSMLALKSSSV